MGNIIVAVQTKLLKNICLFSGQNMQYITCVIRVTWHWGHPPLSLGFVQGHKSIVQLLLTINCALKFYSLFMMCNVMWFMWTQWVTRSNCGCFLRTVPSRRPPKNSSCQSTFSGPVPLRSKHFTAGHHGPEGKMHPSPFPSGQMRGNPNRVFWHMGETVFS